ncbi:DegT/DnrJ/EryC1/StrS family aminotransferase [Verrucomicrobiota bacterium sgz303538]
MTVPFLDLEAHHEPHMDEFSDVIRKVIQSSAFAGGPFVAEFESAFAAYCGCQHAIGVGNGTEALWLALLASGVGPGDEVITSPMTFMATAEAISYCGATPVFVDIDPETYTINPTGIEEAITPRTKAVIPVHLFGQTADMDPILEVARKHRLLVLEDAAQAHGAEYKGRTAGSIGDIGSFSFYPGKNLGAFGEAGALVTNDARLAESIRILRDHGQVRKYHHTMIGWNGRMDGIQGAVLNIKLRHLDKANERRRQHAEHYTAALRGLDEIVTPLEATHSRHVYHVYAIRVRERDAVMRTLNQNGVGCGIHYPVPIHLQEAYRYLGFKRGAFPVAEQCADEFLSLPMYPELTEEQVDLAIASVAHAVAVEVAA